MKKLYNRFRERMMPQPCLLCQNKTQSELILCGDCIQTLPEISYACHLCGRPLPTKISPCGDCIKKIPPFYKTIVPFTYEFPINRFIQHLKFSHQLLMAPLLGKLFIKQWIEKNLNSPKPEYLIPVPLHPKRLRERGFNQSIEISKGIARELKIPLLREACQRIRYTSPQARLPADKRHKNIRQAFTVDENFRAKHVALFDDVITTGETVSGLARAFKKAGVKKIEIWSIARTHLK